jgi:hypothetical protein
MEGMVALMLPVVLMPMFLLCLNCVAGAWEDCRSGVNRIANVWYL